LRVENNLEAIHKDKTPTLTKALILFCERARSFKPPVPITVESVYAKAKNIATKSILDLDASSLCHSLVELQEVLDHHGVSDATECIEKGRNILMRASWKDKKSCCPN